MHDDARRPLGRMSENIYLKCACTGCGGRIEFPAAAAGRRIDCPHCGQPTQLQNVPVAPAPDGLAPGSRPLAPMPAVPRAQKAPVEKLEPVVKPTSTKVEDTTPSTTKVSEKRNIRQCRKCGADLGAGARICVQCGAGIRNHGPLVWVAATTVLVVALAAGGWWFWKRHPQEPAAPVLVKLPNPTNKPPISVELPKEPKSPNDLKVSALTIEKSKSSGKDKAKISELLYAMGTVKNESDWQRFGVKVTCDLFDANGVNLGTATDYIQIIEPRKSWTFRALALDKKVVSARLGAIKEDE